MNRRALLSNGAVVLSGLLSGCGYNATAGSSSRREKTLQLLFPEVTDIESGWRFTATVFPEATGLEPVFHDVKIYAYDSERAPVGETHVGDMENSEDAEIYCSGFPDLVVLDAKESTCEETVTLGIAEYDGREDDGGHEWKQRNRACEESLPHVGANGTGENR